MVSNGNSKQCDKQYPIRVVFWNSTLSSGSEADLRYTTHSINLAGQGVYRITADIYSAILL